MMDHKDTQKKIENGKTALGIELGSTRIKAVLIDEDHTSIASGSYEWENKYENGIWTYSLDDVWTGLQESYQKLNKEVFYSVIPNSFWNGSYKIYTSLYCSRNYLCVFIIFRN